MSAVDWIPEDKCPKCGMEVKTNSDIEIYEMSFKDGKTEIEYKSEKFRQFVSNVILFMFKQDNGTNYVEFNFVDQDKEEFSCLIQKKSGKTPAEMNTVIRNEYSARITELQNEINELKNEVNK
jgi:hypothetical protein